MIPLLEKIPQAIINLWQVMPLRRKAALFYSNNLHKVRHLKGCCGRPGQPGC